MKQVLILSFFLFIILNLPAQNIFRTTCNGDLSRLDSMLLNQSINEKDNRERSLIHWAVACDKAEIFDYLIAKGININAEDDQNKTAMHMAIRFDRANYFDKLYALQPNKDWIAKFGASLLQDAVMRKNKPFIEKLVKYGINVDSKNDRGSTALEIAQRIGAEDISALLDSLGADPSLVRKVEVEGKYMGQKLPGAIGEIFANNFISTEEYEFGSVFSADGTEFYYGVDVGNNTEIRFSKLTNGKWSQPVVILSHEVYGYNDPFLSPDEQRLYFISRRAMDGAGAQKEDYDIWYVERQGYNWSEPINAGPNINSDGNEYYISFTKDGTMYFSSNKNAPEERKNADLDIYYSKFENGAFQAAVRLGDAINTEAYEADVFIDPDEQYIIFCSTREGGLGRGDLYISFKNEDETWTKAINMGEAINTKHHELCPFVTVDGKYFFYTSDEDIYWVSTTVFEKLRETSK